MNWGHPLLIGHNRCINGTNGTPLKHTLGLAILADRTNKVTDMAMGERATLTGTVSVARRPIIGYGVGGDAASSQSNFSYGHKENSTQRVTVLTFLYTPATLGGHFFSNNTTSNEGFRALFNLAGTITLVKSASEAVTSTITVSGERAYAIGFSIISGGNYELVIADLGNGRIQSQTLTSTALITGTAGTPGYAVAAGPFTDDYTDKVAAQVFIYGAANARALRNWAADPWAIFDSDASPFGLNSVAAGEAAAAAFKIWYTNVNVIGGGVHGFAA